MAGLSPARTVPCPAHHKKQSRHRRLRSVSPGSPWFCAGQQGWKRLVADQHGTKQQTEKTFLQRTASSLGTISLVSWVKDITAPENCQGRPGAQKQPRARKSGTSGAVPNVPLWEKQSLMHQMKKRSRRKAAAPLLICFPSPRRFVSNHELFIIIICHSRQKCMTSLPSGGTLMKKTANRKKRSLHRSFIRQRLRNHLYQSIVRCMSFLLVPLPGSGLVFSFRRRFPAGIYLIRSERRGWQGLWKI